MYCRQLMTLKTKSAIFLPEKARYDYLLNLPDGEDVGKAVNDAMGFVEDESEQLKGILPRSYTIFKRPAARSLAYFQQQRT